MSSHQALFTPERIEPEPGAPERIEPEPRAPKEITGLLAEIARLLSADQSNLSVGGLRIGTVIGNSPSWGMRRRIISSGRAFGNDNFAVPAATPTQLCGHNAGRIGGSIVNIGTNPCFVYLCDVGEVNYQNGGGKFCGWLGAQGGSFDFLLADKVWCGPVSVQSPLGTTLVWGAI